MILPGATVGILGSGQLGRMLALVAKRMDYRVHVLSPGSDTPAGGVADVERNAAYSDLDAVRAFARDVNVVTLEFENIPAAALEAASEHAPVRPGIGALYTAQNRLREKTFLSQTGFPVAPFRAVRDADDLGAALRDLGTPAVLKTAGFGYDGKGQATVTTVEEAQGAFAALGGGEAVLEAFVPFERELSVVAARGLDGEFAHYGVIENRHEKHILDVSITPPDVSKEVEEEAVEIARGVLGALDVIGVMCVEFFLTGEGLLINELAPRPHNSGHLTLEAFATSQFENQLRAVCGLPLGATSPLRPAAMANLLGELWDEGVPNWVGALELPEVYLHLYGKGEARRGRKMGHLTALADTPKEAVRRVREARGRLSPQRDL